METIRCPRCQKLLRADALTCSRCGVAIHAGKGTKKIASRTTTDELQPTSPPASPHRAGHYSGLHPEDQPFQSSFFARVQRPTEPEPEQADDQEIAPAPLTPPVYRSSLLTEEEQDSPEFSALADLPTLSPRRVPETPLPETFVPLKPSRSASNLRLVRILVSGSLICFLLATGLLAFLLIGRGQSQAHTTQPRLIALPGELRVGDVLQLAGSGFDLHHVVLLTHDTGLPLLDTQGRQVLVTTDAQGAFQIHVPITGTWNVGVHRLQAREGQITIATSLTIQAAVTGPARLQLGTARVDLGSGNPGTVSHENMTLSNAGGGRVTWSALSNASWLTLSPTSGNFVGNTVVTLTANRANLAPQAYLGQIVFSQNQGSSQTLTVSLTVNTTPANLVLQTASLVFGGTPAQSPAGQTMVIQNNGGQPLNWNATIDGGTWLSVTPATGLLNANTSAILTVNVATLHMALGTYQGALNFSYAGGPTQQVAITLTVNPPPQPAMHLSQQSLSFSTNQGFNPPAQHFTISNPGNGSLNWAIHTDASGLAFLAISPASGSIPPGQSANVSVTPQLASTNGTIKSTLTVEDSDTGTNVPTQQVNVTIAITNQPVITVITGSLEFDHNSSTTDTSTLLIFLNSGSLPLNWTMTESSQVPWLSFDKTSGTLAADNSDYISIRCTSGQMQPGTYTVTVTMKDSDAGTVVAPQSVTVTLVVTA